MFYILLEPLGLLGICYIRCYFEIDSRELYIELLKMQTQIECKRSNQMISTPLVHEWGNEQNSVAGCQWQYHS